MNKEKDTKLFNQAKSTNKILFLVFFIIIFIASVLTVVFAELHNEFILATFPISFFGSVFISNKILSRSYSKEIIDALPPVNELFTPRNQDSQFISDNNFANNADFPFPAKNTTFERSNDRICDIEYHYLPYNIHHDRIHRNTE